MDNNGRLLSIDALRGFDMLFLIGLDPVLRTIASIFGWPGLAAQTEHVPWIGLHLEDLIFPTFLFLAGASWPFSCRGQLERNRTKGQIVRRILKRAGTLFILGLLIDGILRFNFANVRYLSVLGRIGIAWAVAALVSLFGRPRTTVITLISLLVGYWLLLYLPPLAYAPGADPFALDVCVVRRFDLWLWPGHLLHDQWGTEWILATFGSIATALLGVLTGDFLMRSRLSPFRKVGVMFGGGMAVLAVGLLVLPVCPCIKNAWTSSFVLIAGGIALMLLAAFGFLIEGCGLVKWAFVFIVVGMNSIAIYMLQWAVDFTRPSTCLFGGLASLCQNPAYSTLVLQVGRVVCCWLLLYFMYRRKVFIKI